ncbi:K(+)/H(+) antiporter [Scheffersomyces stipitis CBS 6054]|uniref:K(+)/H(+) antiporter n=1 Tax=Scheffersomyces stipitis (strain ATCC 58785 / CBS 6054 / NBRC 10063 / NRRL Y-11545) TaxID=322104 RepID=A3LRD7_PICST|nr:K(+)/H(+) antiporter [Scheffersomyces stipitis CBS 6054]ABN65367.2 K(+)/H(+) antiporter [Scheffersomyces stipitis CBS 6054]
MAVETSTVAGVVSGRNPLAYSASSPYTLFMFQAVFIILFAHIIHYPLKKLRQPRVIAEVITGILLGPTVMGRIPNFTATCFPAASIPGLTLFANIGIILFLFIIGLEVDISFIRKNLRVAATVGLINMAVPFALGCAIAKGFYDQYRVDDDTAPPIKFTTYMVFIAVAMCITAFPVLARILTELNLIGDRVGTIVLAAGITNDLTGWILLALTVTLANSSRGINTLYILLLTVAWFIFLLYPVRLALRFVLKKFTNDLVSGEPSQVSMMLIVVMVFISAFYTDIIGVHPIFGAFMVGIIVPRDKGYVIRITEKLEDLVHIVLIPLYFAIAGLNVNLGLLNKGIDWGYTIGIIILAMVGKIFGGFISAKMNKLLWRESLAVGVLMSCKGIVEIVVLNVGLNAGILSHKVYSMFIVMALVTTFATTPLTLLVYPVSYREKRDKFIRGEITWDGQAIEGSTDSVSTNLLDEDGNKISFVKYSIEDLSNYRISKVVLLLKKIDTISYLMTFIQNFSSSDTNIRAVHLREFTSRTSHLLEASSTQYYDQEKEKVAHDFEYSDSFSILSIIKVFSEMLGINCSSRSILTTTRNQVLSINDQISDSSNLLVSSIKLNQLSTESQEYELYKNLFLECRSHIGLLLVNEPNSKPSTSAIQHAKDSKAFSFVEDDSFTKRVIDLNSINLVLTHDNLVSSSDLLSIQLVSQIISTNQKLHKVNIFIKSSGQSGPSSDNFENQIKELFSSKNPHIDLSINYIKPSANYRNEILKINPNLANEIFIIANNSSGETNLSQDALFDEDVDQLVNLSLIESFHILVVKASRE